MKKIIILLILFSSCKKEEFYYPSKKFFDDNRPKELIIDGLNFLEITDSIRNGLFEGEILFIQLRDSKNIYNIAPFADIGGLIKERNALEIYNDSIYVSINKYHLKNLAKYLKLHYENNGKEYDLPISYKRAFIKLILEPEDSPQKLQKSLVNIIHVYNKTQLQNKDSIELGIMLVYYPVKVFPHSTPPPPIPIVLED